MQLTKVLWKFRNTCSFLFPNMNTCQEPSDVLKAERYLSPTISLLGTVTVLFCSFRSIYGQTRGFICLFYNYKNNSNSSSSHPIAMSISCSFFKLGLAMWRTCAGVRTVGQFNSFVHYLIFMRSWSIRKWLQILSQLSILILLSRL